MTSPTLLSGTLAVTSMIGSSSTGLACSSACLMAIEPASLERHLGRVDGVVGAVEDASRARP